MKDPVYRINFSNIPELNIRIADTFTHMTEEMRRKLWYELEHRLDILCASDGPHVELQKYSKDIANKT